MSLRDKALSLLLSIGKDYGPTQAGLLRNVLSYGYLTSSDKTQVLRDLHLMAYVRNSSFNGYLGTTFGVTLVRGSNGVAVRSAATNSCLQKYDDDCLSSVTRALLLKHNATRGDNVGPLYLDASLHYSPDNHDDLVINKCDLDLLAKYTDTLYERDDTSSIYHHYLQAYQQGNVVMAQEYLASLFALIRRKNLGVGKPVAELHVFMKSPKSYGGFYIVGKDKRNINDELVYSMFLRGFVDRCRGKDDIDPSEWEVVNGAKGLYVDTDDDVDGFKGIYLVINSSPVDLPVLEQQEQLVLSAAPESVGDFLWSLKTMYKKTRDPTAFGKLGGFVLTPQHTRILNAASHQNSGKPLREFVDSIISVAEQNGIKAVGTCVGSAVVHFVLKREGQFDVDFLANGGQGSIVYKQN